MGLFTNGKYHCVICGTKVKKKVFALSDGERVCMSCNRKVTSSYVLSELRTEIGYPSIDTKQMKQMQAFFEEAAKRAKQFAVTFKNDNLIVDETHGWYFIINKDTSSPFTDMKELLKQPIEIFSVYEVDKIEYRAHRFAFDSKNYEFYYFKHKDSVLPYVPYNVIELSMNRDKSSRLDVKFSQIFPYAEVDVPSYGMDAIIRTAYIEVSADIEQLSVQRKVLNEKFEQRMTAELSDKCKHLATQYIKTDKQLVHNLELLEDVKNFANDILLKENIAECNSYLSRMVKLHQEIEIIIMKQTK